MSSTLQRVRFTASEYTRMASILAGRRTELIDGEIIEMAPIGTAHLVVVDRLERHLARLKAEGRLQSGQPVRIRDYDEPQPDLSVPPRFEALRLMCAIAARAHISRFGQYTLDPSRTPRPVDYELPILSTVTADDRPAPASTKAKAVRSGCGAAKRRAGRIGDPQG